MKEPRISAAERERQEFQKALAAAEAIQPALIQPSAEEARNGWTPETLTKYLNEHSASVTLRVDPHSTFNRRARRPTQANNKYRVQRWRG